MRIKSHVPRTLIALLASAVNDWRRAEGWSRETVVQMIVEHHQRIGGEQLTGLVFAPPSIEISADVEIPGSPWMATLNTISRPVAL